MSVGQRGFYPFKFGADTSEPYIPVNIMPAVPAPFAGDKIIPAPATFALV